MRNLIYTCAIAIMLSSSIAKADLAVETSIGGVTVSPQNTSVSSMAGYKSCDKFTGTIQNNTVWITPRGRGGSGNYQHTLVWRFGSAYEKYNGFEQQFEQNVRDGYSYGITLPALRGEIPFAQQSVLIITKDMSTGKSTTTTKMFTVSRAVVLSQSSDPQMMGKNCFQRYPAFPSTVGVLSDGSANTSELTIKQGVQKLWDNSSGTSWGFYVSPLSWVSFAGFSLGNLISFNRNYFSNISKQTSETVEVSSGYQLSPGDFIQIYTQKTRYVTFYDATAVDTCGATQTIPGAYQMQWWGFAYHAVPVNPFDSSPPLIDNVGARPMNTCPKSLDTGFDSESQEFYQTNL